MEDLRLRLSLGPADPLPDALAPVPVEGLVRAFFTLVQPFAEMWADLLELFERASATESGQQLDIRYEFSAEEHLDLRLEHFRTTMRAVRRTLAHFDLTGRSGNLWAVSAAFRTSRNDTRLPEDLNQFVRAWQSRPYPERIPAPPRTGDPELDRVVEETWWLAGTVLEDLRQAFGDHATARAADPDDDRPTASGLSYRELLAMESDIWLVSLVESAGRALAAPVGPGLADRVEAALAPLRNIDLRRTDLVTQLYDVLSLPMWKYRYELYSNWVTTQVVSALDDQEPVVHAVDGRIVFAFSGTHLATWNRPRPPLHLWTEYRTPLAKRVGKRKGHIQPDIAVRQAPLTAGRVPLIVECKQYARANSRSFAAALTDYARGHPGARVVLVNYGGGVEPTILARVAPEVRHRTRFIGELVRVARWLPATYVLEVSNFSGTPPLGTSGAVVTARVGPAVWTFTCPLDVTGPTWEVCRIDGRTSGPG